MGKERLTVYLSRSSSDTLRDLAVKMRATSITGCTAGEPSVGVLLEHLADGIRRGTVKIPGITEQAEPRKGGSV